MAKIEEVVVYANLQNGDFAYIQFFPPRRGRDLNWKHPYGQAAEFFERTGGVVGGHKYASPATMVSRARAQIGEEFRKLKHEETPKCLYIKFRASFSHRRQKTKRRRNKKVAS